MLFKTKKILNVFLTPLNPGGGGGVLAPPPLLGDPQTSDRGKENVAQVSADALRFSR